MPVLKHKGELSLGLALLGLCATTLLSPIHPTWWFSILQQGFEAATVGALADWLAVKMLFDEITIGGIRIVPASGIIPRKQEAIAKGAGRLVAEEWLSSDTIQRILDEIDFTEMLADELGRWRQSDRFSVFRRRLGEALADWLDEMETRDRVSRWLEENLGKISVSTWFVKHGTPMDVERNLERLLPEAIERLLEMTASAEVYEAILGRMRAEQKGLLKQLFFDPEDATKKTLLQINDFFREIQYSPDHPLRKKLARSVYDWMQEPALDQVIRDLMKRMAESNWLDERLNEWAGALRAGNGSATRALERLADEIVVHVEKVLVGTLKAELNATIREWVGRLIAGYHGKVSSLVEQNIRSLSPEAMKEQFKSRTYDDMQWIRVNGAVAGFFIGCCLGALHVLFS